MRRHRARLLPLTAASAAAALAVAACGTSTASTTTTSSRHASTNPIVIGTTEPLTGSFSADGQASERGYELWASDINRAGGLLGRPVELKILNDNSDPNKVTKDYTALITQDHVDLTLAPFSSLLTVPASQVTEKYHYALPEGSGGAPSVYQLNDPDLFGVSAPVKQQMVPFANWVLSLPARERPTTAAYPMVADPFADPPVQTAQTILQNGGITTVYTHAPITATNLTPYANAVAAKNPGIVVLGSVDIPTVLAFIHAFEAAHFTPKIFIAASGPDQGQAFINQVGTGNAEAIMVPDGWYGGVQNALSHVMVQDYIAKFGGTASDINADVAEAYSAGEVLADAISGTHSISNAQIISYLHSHTLQTVQGPARFTSDGENNATQAFIFQWQSGRFVQVLPSGFGGSSHAEALKPTWLSG